MARYIWTPTGWQPAVYAPRPRVFPSIIRDQMEATLHPATGQVIDSKSAFRAVTRARGYEEVGNETEALLTPPTVSTAPDLERDIAQAYEMVAQGYTPPPPDTVDADARIFGASE